MTHYVVIHAMMMLWYPKRRPGNPIVGSMIDLDPWRSPGLVEVDVEAQEASVMVKKSLDPHLLD